MPSITALQHDFGRMEFTITVVVVLIVVARTIAALRRRGRLRAASLAAGVGLAVVVAGVLSLTLVGGSPPGDAERRLILDPLQGAWGWDSIAWRPVADNVALFLPVGALAGAVWWRRSVLGVWIGCVAFSIGIEGLQYLTATGRVANTADVIANGAGAALGLLLTIVAGTRSAPRTSRPVRRGTDVHR